MDILIIFLIILLAGSAFFSGVETALMSVSMIKVRALLKQKKRGSDVLYRLKQNPRRLLITILIGNNIVNIAAASIATVIATKTFGSTGVGIATGIMTFLVLVFGEITPKSFATQNAEKISLRVARPLEILGYILLPVIKVLECITSGIMKLSGSKEQKLLTEEELRTIVTMGKEEGILNREIADMMKSLLEFEGTHVEEVMTPKSEIAFINGNARLWDIMDYLIKTPYTKYPVYKKTTDKIIGILNVKNILKYIKQKTNVKIKDIIDPVYFVPETKEIDQLLTEFQKRKTQIAIVVNEYGDVIGLVTIEDILEEIVGDIFDKSTRPGIFIKPISEKMIIADAKVSIEQIGRFLHVGLKDEHFNTIAGLIEHKIGKIPKIGEKLDLKKVKIIVEDADKQSIKKVKIIKK
jgi:Mg2+/Co2+ transporter CorB